MLLASFPEYADMPTLDVIEADITTLQVDAIVNAANETLLGGGGQMSAFGRCVEAHRPRESAPQAGCRRPGCLLSDGSRSWQRLDDAGAEQCSGSR
jgi:hypothetical protein